MDGAWRSLVARTVRDRKVAGSNPVAPTFFPEVYSGYIGNTFGAKGFSPGGDFRGLDPTGKRFQMHCAFLFFFAKGNIEREVRLYDFTGILVQLGVLKAKPAF